MTRPDQDARQRRRAERRASVPASRLTSDISEDLPPREGSGHVIDLTGLEPDGSIGAASPQSSATTRLQVEDQPADAPAMAETTPEPAQVPHEAGVSFSMTTTAQVQLRDNIRRRTQEKLDDLRSARSA